LAQGALGSKGTGVVDVFAGLLDDHRCPLCGVGELVEVDELADDRAGTQPDRVCLACENAVFVDPILVFTASTARHSTRSARFSAA
jgi:hypothetical protein